MILAEYDFDVAYKAGKTTVNADVLSRNPIDLGDIENNDINTKGSIEINSIEKRNGICMSDFEREEKVPETNLACYEKMDYDIIEENIKENIKRIILKNFKNL